MRRFTFVMLMVAVGIVTVGARQNPAGQSHGNAQFRIQPGNTADDYIVVLRDAGPRGAASRAPEMARQLRATHRFELRHVYTHVLNGFSARMPRAAAEALSRDSRVEYVEQALIARAEAIQVSPPSWGLDRIDQRSGLSSSYEYSNTGSGVKVYVVDSGIRITHTEFGGRATYGPNFDSTWSGVSDDCSGHGTHVAGTIGGATVGVAKAVNLISVRVFNCGNTGTTPDLLAAINWVTQHHIAVGGPSVANFSGGVGPVGWEFTAVDDAVRQSIDTGVTWTVAAMNASDWVFNYSPARVDQAITTGAATETDQRAWFSNYGPQVDLFGPGTNIVSAINWSDTAYATASGTSMAAPHAAGVAARMLQYQPWAPPGHIAGWMVWQSTQGAIGDPGPGTQNNYIYSKFIDELIASAIRPDRLNPLRHARALLPAPRSNAGLSIVP